MCWRDADLYILAFCLGKPHAGLPIFPGQSSCDQDTAVFKVSADDQIGTAIAGTAETAAGYIVKPKVGQRTKRLVSDAVSRSLQPWQRLHCRP